MFSTPHAPVTRFVNSLVWSIVIFSTSTFSPKISFKHDFWSSMTLGFPSRSARWSLWKQAHVLSVQNTRSLPVKIIRPFALTDSWITIRILPLHLVIFHDKSFGHADIKLCWVDVYPLNNQILSVVISRVHRVQWDSHLIAAAGLVLIL